MKIICDVDKTYLFASFTLLTLERCIFQKMYLEDIRFLYNHLIFQILKVFYYFGYYSFCTFLPIILFDLGNGKINLVNHTENYSLFAKMVSSWCWLRLWLTIDVFVLQGIVLYWLNNVRTSFLNMLYEATEHVWLLHLDFQKSLDMSAPKVFMTKKGVMIKCYFFFTKMCPNF